MKQKIIETKFFLFFIVKNQRFIDIFLSQIS
jgi:hypothetical protein